MRESPGLTKERARTTLLFLCEVGRVLEKLQAAGIPRDLIAQCLHQGAREERRKEGSMTEHDANQALYSWAVVPFLIHLEDQLEKESDATTVSGSPERARGRRLIASVAGLREGIRLVPDELSPRDVIKALEALGLAGEHVRACIEGEGATWPERWESEWAPLLALLPTRTS